MLRSIVYCWLIIIFGALKIKCSDEQFSNFSHVTPNTPEQMLHHYALQRLRLRNTGILPILVPEQQTALAIPEIPKAIPAAYTSLPAEIREYITSLLDTRSIWALAHVSHTENSIAARFIPLILTPHAITESNLHKNQERYSRVRELLIKSGARETVRPYHLPLIARFFPRITCLRVAGACFTVSLAEKLSTTTAFAQIEHLDLSGSSYEKNSGRQIITCLAQAAFAKFLKIINFSRTGFTKLEGFALSDTDAFPALQELDFSHNPECDVYVLSNIAYRTFTSHIKTLKMANTGLDQGWKLTHLKQKAVHMQNTVCEQDVPTFMAIEVLDVSDNALGDISIRDCIFNAVFAPKLLSLRIANTGITALAIRYLIETQTLIELRELDISYNNLTESVSQLSKAIFCDQLRVLNISGTGITDQVLLDCIASMPNLEILVINDNIQLTYVALSQVIQNLAKLKKLIVRNLDLKQEGMKQLKELAQEKALELRF